MERRIGSVILVAVVAVLVVLGFRLTVLPSSRPTPQPTPTTLPIPAGTVLHFTRVYEIRFNVSGSTARIVGAWYADHGGSVLINQTDRPGLISLPCYSSRPWNATLDETLLMGQYTLDFSGFGGDTLTVTQNIELVYPGGSAATSFYFSGSSCAGS